MAESFPRSEQAPQPRGRKPKSANAEQNIAENTSALENSPLVFDTVRFEQFKTKKGTEYKSSELGRKKIVLLNPEGQNVDLDRAYRVRVVRDTQPEDPKKGVYEVEIISNSKIESEFSSKAGKPAFRQTTYEAIGGKTIIIDQRFPEFLGFTVGDSVTLKPRVSLDPQAGQVLRNAQKLVLVGFRLPKAVIQPDDGKVALVDIGALEKTFAEAKTERQLRFTSLEGQEIIVDPNILQVDGFVVGDELRLTEGAKIPNINNDEIKDIKVVGFINLGPTRPIARVAQINGDKVVVFQLTGGPFEKKSSGSLGEQNKFQLSNGRDIFVDPTVQKSGNFELGDKLRLQARYETIPLFQKYSGQPNIEVIGFRRTYGNTLQPVILIDNKDIEFISPYSDSFEKVSDNSTKETQQVEFIRYDGATVRINPEITATLGFTIGDRVRVFTNSLSQPAEFLVRDARELKVVGFSNLNAAVVQADGGRVVSLIINKDVIEKVQPQQSEEESSRGQSLPQEVPNGSSSNQEKRQRYITVLGDNVEIDPQIAEAGQYKMGDTLRLTTESGFSELDGAKEIEVVGFYSEDNNSLGRIIGMVVKTEEDKYLDFPITTDIFENISVFRLKFGEKIVADPGIREYGGFVVGEQLRVRDIQKDVLPDAREAKIVGFKIGTVQGVPSRVMLIQINDDYVQVDGIPPSLFERIPEPERFRFDGEQEQNEDFIDELEEEIADESFDDFNTFSGEDDEDESVGLVNRREGFDHKGALKARVEHLKRSRSFQALANMLKDPELRREYDLMLTRRKEILALQEGEEKHRALAPMTVALMMGKRTKPLFEMVIDKSVQERSQTVKEAIRDNPRVFVPEVVVGSGPHSAIYNLNRQMVLPDNPGLTLERNQRIGGQFSQIEAPLFRLNSRTRPMQRNTPATPGTPQTLNTFTDYAVTNPADTGMESYQSQSVMADHARLNLFLAGEPVTGTEVRRIRKNNEIESEQGRYVVECIDTQSQKLIEVSTDRVVFTTGVGEERNTLNNDPTTQKILREEKDKIRFGEDAQVMSFAEAARRLGNPEDPFPLKGFKNIILSGEGDGAKVLAGLFLGYESQRGMSTTQLDWIEKIIWMGQSAVIKEEFLQECRVRYHQLGLEFPREQAEEYFSRIQPEPLSRAVRVERTKSGGVRVFTDREESFEGDHYIYAHGFEDNTSQIVKTVDADVLDRPASIANIFESRGRELRRLVEVNVLVTLFFNKENPIDRVELRNTGRVLEYTQIDRNGLIATFETRSEQLFDLLSADFETTQNLARAILRIETVPQGSNSVFEPYRVPGLNDDLPVASVLRGEAVYKAGPAAALPLSEEEVERSQALGNIPENTAAVFRYAQYTALLAQLLAQDDKRIGIPIQNQLLPIAKQVEEQREPPSVRGIGTRIEVRSSVTTPGKVSYDMPMTDIVRFSLGSVLEGKTFPEGLSKVEFTINPKSLQEGSNKSEPLYTLESDTPLPQRLLLELRDSIPGYATVALERIMGEERGARKRMPVKISVPLERGKVDAANIRYESLKV